MFAVDDPLLALILRFVVNTGQSPAENREFLRRQVKNLHKYLTQFPVQEQGARAMEWIEQHAEQYRRDWERRTVSSRTVYLRCEDCPLASRGAAEHCEIHEQWLYLLGQYTAGHVNSRSYIESALALLRQHKNALVLRGGRVDKGSAKPIKKKSKKRKDKKKKDKKRKKDKKGKKGKKGK